VTLFDQMPQAITIERHQAGFGYRKKAGNNKQQD
jgi:hypothetical protein